VGVSLVLPIHKKRYYVLLVDQFPIYMWFILKAKTKVLEMFQTLHRMLERHFNTKFLSFYTDGGGEFLK